MDYYKIGKVQAIALILILILNHLVLSLPKNIYLLTGNSILLNIVWIVFLMILFTIFIIKLFNKFDGQDLLDISEFVGGKILKLVIAIIYIIFFITVAGILLRDFVEGLKILYYSQVPTWLLSGIMLFVPVIANQFGGNTVTKFNSIAVCITMISLLFVLITSTTTYVPQKVFPILGNGINETFFSGITNLYAFSGFCFLYFMIPLLKSNKDLKKIGRISIIIGSIYLFFTLLSLLFSFSSLISIYEISPIYLILRATELGSFFQRPDALFVFTWILSLMSYLSVTIMFCNIIFKKISNIKTTKYITFIFVSLCFIVCLIPQNLSIIKILEDTFYRYSTIALAFILPTILLLIGTFKNKYIGGKPK